MRPATVGILGGGPNRFEATSRTPVCTPVWLMTPLMVLLVPPGVVRVGGCGFRCHGEVLTGEGDSVPVPPGQLWDRAPGATLPLYPLGVLC